MKTYRIATVPGDGIGKEVVPAGQAGSGSARAEVVFASSSKTSTGVETISASMGR